MNLKLSSIVLIVLLLLSFSTIAYAESIQATVYHDRNKSSRSNFDQEIGTYDVLLPDMPVTLISDSNEVTLLTDENGQVHFDDLESGNYFLKLDLYNDPPSTSRNRPVYVYDAIDRGDLTIVAMGDSIGVYGPEVMNFPERLAEHFAPIVDTTVHNIHASGSATWQWIPGADAAFFEDRLLPVLPEADLVTITLIGNDGSPYVDYMGSRPYDIVQIIQNILDNPDYILEAVPRLNQIVENIHAVNPNCDIVYVIYPNFGNSTYMMNTVTPILQPLISQIMKLAMEYVRATIWQHGFVTIADMLHMVGDEWITDYQIDEVHPNDAGAALYAKNIFQTLGGVVIDGENSFGQEHSFGIHARSLIPEDADDDDDDSADDDDDDATDDDDDTTDDDDATDDDDTADDDDTTDDDIGYQKDEQEENGCCG